MAIDTSLVPSVPTPPDEKMTYEEFLTRLNGTHAEWVNGKVILMSPASDQHQDIADFLTALLRFFVETHQAGRVLSAPFQMKIRSDFPGREPDVLFIAGEHLDRLHKDHLEGPADLVIEIISPESAGRDRGDKYYEYEQGGVPEYWLIDPIREQADFYQRDARGIFRSVAADGDGRYYSTVLPDLWLDVKWLWERPLPSLLSVLKAWALI